MIAGIRKLALDIGHLRINVVKGFVVGQRDVLEELDVKEDGELVQLLHQHRYLVIHSLCRHLEVMFSLFEFSHIPDEFLVLFILSTVKSHCAARHILVLSLRLCLAQFRQFDFVMLKLFAVLVPLLIHFSVYCVVHVDVLHLSSKIVENLFILLNDPLIGRHVILDSLEQLLVFIFSAIHDKKEFADLLCLYH